VKSREEIEALLLEVLPALPAELLADGEALREHLGVFPSTGELVDELASTLTLLHTHAPAVPELSEGFTDGVMAALPPAVPGGGDFAAGRAPSGGGGDFAAGRWAWRAAAAAACFALGTLFARWQAPVPTTQAVIPPQQQPADQQPAEQPMEQGTPAEHPLEQQPLEHALPGQLARDPAPRRRVIDPTYVGNPALGDYATNAREVLRALDRLEAQPDPRALRELVLTVQTERLVVRGEVILAELEGGAQPPEGLERLIHGTQLVLRRVRNARGPAATAVVSTLREEVRSTGLLDAYDTLLAAPEPAEQTPSPIESTGPL